MASLVPGWLITICKEIEALGGRAFLVGGYVRDSLLNRSSEDYDLEVYGLSSNVLRELLERMGTVNQVGEHFAIYKLRPNAEPSREVDISLPRRESKRGYGHRGFLIEGDPWMTFSEAASRRDFTINAILQDPLTKTILDPFQGLEDLRNKRLQIVNPKTFADDSLRVLRAAQLASRYDLRISEETILLCRRINLGDLPKERICKELEKLLLLSPSPSVGLGYYLNLGIINQLFPMLLDLQSSPVGYTPYSKGTLWSCTLASIDRAKCVTQNLSEGEELAILISILGIRLSINRLLEFLDKVGIYTRQGYDLRGQIISLFAAHLLPYKIFHQLSKKDNTDEVIKRLARIVNIKLLSRLSMALELDSSCTYSNWFAEKVRHLDLSETYPKPILQGRHILELGIPPGRHVKSLINQVYELQIEGKIKTLQEGQAFALKVHQRVGVTQRPTSGRLKRRDADHQSC